VDRTFERPISLDQVATDRHPHPRAAWLLVPITWCAAAHHEDGTRELPVFSQILQILPLNSPNRVEQGRHGHDRSHSKSWSKSRGHKAWGKDAKHGKNH
jgi:hypothetical protein